MIYRPDPRIQKQVSGAVTFPAPVGGWNARDQLGDMNELDAVELENWFPGTTSVIMRYGHTRHGTGITGQVETLAGYVSGSTSKLFAVAGGTIYDVTSAGAASATTVSGLTNSRFAFANMANTSGAYLFLVNGADKQRIFDGTNWHADGDGVPYDITGVDSANLIHVHNFKSRNWYIEKDTLKVWYLALNAIGGAATALNLSGVFQRGGYLVAMGTWTMDAGYGVDDYAVWVTSQGEVAVYRLTDPTVPSGISLVGLYWIGSPVGRRCMVKYEGDLLILGQDGISPMSTALQSDRLDQRAQLTNKIQFATSSAISNYGSNYGWQMLPFPKQNMLILNVPVQEGDGQQQYVMNTITKSWCKFTGWEANCWELFGDDVYFGGDGFVGKAWNTLTDNGSAIGFNGLQAFNFFKSPGITKRFTMMRPTLFTNGTPSILAAMNIDFNTNDTTSPLSFSPTAYGVWDTAVWDSGIWGADLSVSNAWQGATGQGKSGAVRLKGSASSIQVQWVSTDVVYERGAIL